jgi:hypothetical protein
MSELPEAKKARHEEVDYGDGMRASHCAICEFFIPTKPPRCEIVKSPIEAGDWCNRFRREAA